MKKYLVEKELDYVRGNLRHGHLEGVIEAENEEALKEIIKSGDFIEFLRVQVDDYTVNDYEISDTPPTYEEIEVNE